MSTRTPSGQQRMSSVWRQLFSSRPSLLVSEPAPLREGVTLVSVAVVASTTDAGSGLLNLFGERTEFMVGASACGYQLTRSFNNIVKALTVSARINRL